MIVRCSYTLWWNSPRSLDEHISESEIGSEFGRNGRFSVVSDFVTFLMLMYRSY